MTDNRNGAVVPAEHLRPVATPGRLGQATAVEQSRAVAEVQAAVLVAQQCPRNIEWAKAEMRRACSEYELAKRAFFRFPRGGSQISGASITLARELVRCWGNTDCGISEMRRDDDAAQSEMKAWAWDQQTNARNSNTFIVPHRRDKKGGGPERLTDLRDIYENNANQGARRMREAIFAILPAAFVEEAKTLCTETLERGDGRPLEDRIEGAVKQFARLGVTVDQIERRQGRARGQWNAADIGDLLVVFQSVQQREVTIDDEFPPVRVTAEEITAAVEVAGEPSPVPAATTPATTAQDSPAADGDRITVARLLTALRAAGRIDEKTRTADALKALEAAASELCGVSVAKVEELVVDQAVAEELLAKLSVRAE